MSQCLTFPRPSISLVRDARQAFGKAKPGTAMSDFEAEQASFNNNRERLKAERLAREALEPTETRK